MTRLLYVDGSDLMGWLVAHLMSCDVEIVRVDSFAEANRVLREHPPDAAIFNLTPRHLDWRALIDRCVQHEPVIPYLCCTAIENDEELDGPLPCREEDYFTTSIPKDEFRELLERLCVEAGAGDYSRFSGDEPRRGAREDRNLDSTPG